MGNNTEDFWLERATRRNDFWRFYTDTQRTLGETLEKNNKLTQQLVLAQEQVRHLKKEHVWAGAIIHQAQALPEALKERDRYCNALAASQREVADLKDRYDTLHDQRHEEARKCDRLAAENAELTQSESVALSWMNEALNLRTQLVAAQEQVRQKDAEQELLRVIEVSRKIAEKLADSQREVEALRIERELKLGCWNEYWEKERDRLQTSLDEATDWIRQRIWASHGCEGLYGDDGELQCNNIERHGKPLDFKRMELREVFEVDIRCRLERAAFLAAQPQDGGGDAK